MFDWNDGAALYHYGIPGMKWGVQNGPPYPLGASQKTSKERKGIYNDENYAKRRLDPDKISRIAKIALISAILTGGAVAAYVALKKGPYNNDFEISAGSAVFRVQGSEYTDLPESLFYATADRKDAMNYRVMLGYERDPRTTIRTGRYNNALEIAVNQNVKIAGIRTQREMFNNWIQKDDVSRSILQSVSSDGVDNTVFENFIRHAPMAKQDLSPFLSFQQYMQSHGYGGLLDYNDKTNFEARKPVILFNRALDVSKTAANNGAFSIIKTTNLNESLIQDARKYVNRRYSILDNYSYTELKNAGLVTVGMLGAPLIALNIWAHSLKTNNDDTPMRKT